MSSNNVAVQFITPPPFPPPFIGGGLGRGHKCDRYNKRQGCRITIQFGVRFYGK